MNPVIKPKENRSRSRTYDLTVRESWRIYLRVLRLYYTRFPKAIFAMVASSIWTALSPYAGIRLSALIIEELSGNRDAHRLLILILLTLGLGAVISLISALLSRIGNIHGNEMLMFLHETHILDEKLLDMDFCILDDTKTMDKASHIQQNRFGGGHSLIQAVNTLRSLFSALFTLGGGFALTVSLFTNKVPEDSSKLLWLNHPLFLFLLVGVMAFITWLAPSLASKGESYWAKANSMHNQGNRLFGFRTQYFGSHETSMDVRIYKTDKLFPPSDKTGTFESKGPFARLSKGPVGIYSTLSAVTSLIFTAAVYLFVCLKAWAGAFGIGMVTQYIASITRFSGGISSLVRAFGKMRTEGVFIKQELDFLDIPDVMYQGSLTVEKRNDRKYEVEFRDVSFKYPGCEQYSLRHVNMKFQIGQRLALVGENGSGKTTFIKLLCRLYDPTEGVILLNGIDIRKYNYQEYLSIFSVVFQDFQLTNFTLGENVACKRDYDREMVENVLKKTGFDERYRELPLGTDTYLSKKFSEDGVDMSGGEQQKIAIARALYKDSPFIILDEPTAALDPMAEAEIYNRFGSIVEDRTAICISHRLSSCRFCDDILVFDKGTIVQQGSHDSLVQETDGKYHELWFAQAQYYTDTQESSDRKISSAAPAL